MIDRIERISKALPALSVSQLKSIDSLVEQFQRPFSSITINPQSDLLIGNFAEDFGDMLRLHHCFSKGPFSKDKFEYALEEACNLDGNGHSAELALANNPTFDITVNGQKYSLKTEASKKIQLNKIHISKFMELGKGDWTDQIEDLYKLRDAFLTRLRQCDRILILRAIKKNPWQYELIEIPTDLLEKASSGSFKQAKPKNQPKAGDSVSGYCVIEEGPEKLFQLYFDGAGERKLQIQHLQKKHCFTHATWKFDLIPVLPDSEDGTAEE